MDALIVVDMQVGLLEGLPKYDLGGVVARLGAVAASVRKRGGRVVSIRHCGPSGDAFATGAPGWAFLPDLLPQPEDLVIEKRLNDAFAGTELAPALRNIGATRLLIGGWATDFCVDATVRSAVSHGHAVTVVADGHTVSDRPHLEAAGVIRHHHWIWRGLIADKPLRLESASRLIDDGR